MRLRDARKRAGLTQEELAERAGLAQSVVSRAEKGLPVAEESLAKIASALGLTADAIDVEAPTPSSASHDAAVIPSLEQRPGWGDVFARAKSDAPDIDAEDWETLAKSPGLFAFDAALTPALLIDLARVVRRHRPPKR
jgi:transcriptional regulator with XRE-family HTH domain